MTVTLPERNIAEITQMLTTSLVKQFLDARTLARLIGKLISCR